MAIRDKECTADGCSIPAAWCEAHHHRKPWSKGGRTDLADGKLLAPSTTTAPTTTPGSPATTPNGRPPSTGGREPTGGLCLSSTPGHVPGDEAAGMTAERQGAWPRRPPTAATPTARPCGRRAAAAQPSCPRRRRRPLTQAPRSGIPPPRPRPRMGSPAAMPTVEPLPPADVRPREACVFHPPRATFPVTTPRAWRRASRGLAAAAAHAATPRPGRAADAPPQLSRHARGGAGDP